MDPTISDYSFLPALPVAFALVRMAWQQLQQQWRTQQLMRRKQILTSIPRPVLVTGSVRCLIMVSAAV